jgi:uncharacterized protein
VERHSAGLRCPEDVGKHLSERLAFEIKIGVSVARRGLNGCEDSPEGEMMYRYLIITIRTPQFLPSVIDEHYAFLDRLRRQGILELAGPFTDKSGGAYLIKTANLDEARALAFSDPLHTTNSSVVTVYEWNAK